jgi:hypothetical protein
MTVHEIRSISKVGTTEPFELQVSRGQIPAHYPQFKFGFNADVNDTLETVWAEGGLYYHPSSATQMTVSSSSDDDTANEGDGARTVELFGLDADYNEISETILLDGTSAVTTTKSFLRINRGIVRSAGDNEVASGTIYAGTGTLTLGKPANVYLSILPADGQTLMALWTVPAGYTAYLTQSDVTVTTIQDNKFATVSVVARPEGQVFQVKDKFVMDRGVHNQKYDFPLEFAEKTDIEVRCVANSSNANVNISAGLDLVYIKNDSRL